MLERKDQRSIYPPGARSGSSSSSPDSSTVEAKVLHPKMITRRGAIFGLGGTTVVGILGGIGAGRRIEIGRHNDSVLEGQLRDRENEIAGLKRQIEELSGGKQTAEKRSVELGAKLIGCEAKQVSEDVQHGAEVGKLKVGWEAEKVEFQAKLLGKQAEVYAWQVLSRANKGLLAMDIDSNKDAAIIGLCTVAKTAASLIENEGKKLEGFVNGVDFIFESTKKLIVWYKESLDITDHLAEITDQGLLVISGAVRWVDAVTEKAMGDKVEKSIDWLLDQLGEKYPKVKEIRQTILKAKDYVENKLPAEIKKRETKRKEAKEEWWEAQKLWIKTEPGWPLRPVLDVIGKIADWEKGQAGKVKEFTTQNEALVEERQKVRGLSLKLAEKQTLTGVTERAKAILASGGQITEREVEKMSEQLLGQQTTAK